MKCSYCRLIPTSIVPPLPAQIVPKAGEHLGHHQYKYGQDDVLPDLPALAASAASGCDMCQMLRRQLQVVFPEWIKDHGYTRLSDLQAFPCYIDTFAMRRENDILADSYKLAQDAPYELSFQIYVPSLGDVPMEIPFHIRAAEDSCAATLGGLRRRPILKDPLSPRNVREIQDFVDQCLHGHAACQVNNDRGFVPTRLLILGDTSDEHVTLGHTEGIPHPCKYVALSYAWGSGANFTVTTSQSLHVPKIRLDSLPATFRDAIRMCCALGVKYLWIDALCIAQDDPHDWAHESSLMHLIYAHAYFTLAATRSCSANDGFLQPRCNDEVSFKYPRIEPGNSSGTFMLVANPTLMRYNELFSNVELSPWNKKRWTFQERNLARRTLHVTETILFMECRTTDWIEDDRPLASIVGRVGRFIPRDTVGTTLSRNELLQCWYSMVGQYSARSITYPRDTFSAISGVAHEVGQLLGDTYVAGLWLNDLENGLLWWPDLDYTTELSPIRTTDRPSQWIAPSWSWAPMTCPVYFIDQPPVAPSQISVIAVDIVPESKDVMGGLRSASLTLWGKLHLVKVVQRQPDDRGALQISLDGVEFYGRGHSNDREYIPSSHVHALPIRIVCYTRETTECLLLETAHDQPGSFRRVGTMMLPVQIGEAGNEVQFLDNTEPQPVRLI